jgi:hypothetical protein
VSVPNSQAPAHWSKDFVEHLRTVHFVLIAVSVGLILIVAESKSYDLFSAYLQIKEIIAMQQHWSPAWILGHGAPQFDTSEPFMVSATAKESLPLETFTPRTGRTKIYGTVHTRKGVEKVVSSVVFVLPEQNWTPTIGAGHLDVDPVKFPETLKDFREWWNRLGDGAISLDAPFYLFLEGEVVGQNEKWNHVLISPRNEPVPNKPLMEVPVELEPTGFSLSYTGFLPNTNLRLRLYAPTRQHVDLTRPRIMAEFSKRPDGSFEKSFPDLARASDNYGAFRLTDVMALTAEEATKSSQVFEAFGLKFPTGRVAIWGVTVILCVQLYLFIYVKQLSGRLKQDDPGWDVPWIGMVPSLIPRSLFFASLVLLPCLTVTLLGWQTALRLSSASRVVTKPIPMFINSTWQLDRATILYILLLGLSVIASAYLGLRSWKYRPQIAPEAPTPPSCPAQLFE